MGRIPSRQWYDKHVRRTPSASLVRSSAVATRCASWSVATAPSGARTPSTFWSTPASRSASATPSSAATARPLWALPRALSDLYRRPNRPPPGPCSTCIGRTAARSDTPRTRELSGLLAWRWTSTRRRTWIGLERLHRRRRLWWNWEQVSAARSWDYAQWTQWLVVPPAPRYPSPASSTPTLASKPFDTQHHPPVNAIYCDSAYNWTKQQRHAQGVKVENWRWGNCTSFFYFKQMTKGDLRH